MYDTVIIGAGMSGLAAGIRLAYYDQRVCVLERHTTIGGLNSFYRLDGRNHDVGLHAVTNFSKPGTRKGPLSLALRQLRLTWDHFALCPQQGSAIVFPDARLSFTNEYEFFESEIARVFPDQIDAFRRMVGQVVDYSELYTSKADTSAREFVTEFLTDPLLVEMLFCPLMFYGNAREHDMDYAQFCIMFRSLFVEGLGRPYRGVRLILKNLVRKYKGLGGELKLRSGVREFKLRDDRVTVVVLDDGTQLETKRVISSAGWPETMRFCGDSEELPEVPEGKLSFVETISVLDTQPQKLGFGETTFFFNDSEKFDWSSPQEYVDCRSGVICSPNNYVYDQPLPEGMIRTTCLANYDRWNALEGDEYALQKMRWYDRIAESAVRFIPEFRSRVIATDTFTPTTIRRFTSRMNGAIYGAPRKTYDGRTHLSNLFLCGTDQGYIGIVGALVGGVSVANLILREENG
jgi:phytoene dehydrogenase-like protein